MISTSHSQITPPWYDPVTKKALEEETLAKKIIKIVQMLLLHFLLRVLISTDLKARTHLRRVSAKKAPALLQNNFSAENLLLLTICIRSSDFGSKLQTSNWLHLFKWPFPRQTRYHGSKLRPDKSFPKPAEMKDSFVISTASDYKVRYLRWCDPCAEILSFGSSIFTYLVT